MKLVSYDLWLGSLGRLLVGWHPKQASICDSVIVACGRRPTVEGRRTMRLFRLAYVHTESFTSFTFQRKSSIAESKVSKISFQTGNSPWRCVIIVKVKKSHLGAEGCSLSCDNRYGSAVRGSGAIPTHKERAREGRATSHARPTLLTLARTVRLRMLLLPETPGEELF